jgi:hypothetical protein
MVVHVDALLPARLQRSASRDEGACTEGGEPAEKPAPRRDFTRVLDGAHRYGHFSFVYMSG